MTYEYECKKCDRIWEVDQKITDPVIAQCPYCGDLEVRRLISGNSPPFILKGKGWYSDGYCKE
jgi:putative FmdB family regulatory protein